MHADVRKRGLPAMPEANHTPDEGTPMVTERRPMKWDAMAAIIASLVGFLALLVAGYTAYIERYTADIQRQQVRAEVWPYLQTAISPSRQAMSLENKGVGPAMIRYVAVFVDGKPRRSWPEVFDALGLSDLRNTPSSTTNGVVLAPGDVIQQMAFRDQAAFARFYKQYPRIQLLICYCSALGDCWRMDERNRARDARRSQVSSCPTPDADEFIDNRLLPPPGLREAVGK